ncbi:MAG: glycosyltransferase family 4 protein [Gemmatimonadales bacterium]|nr:glycosyltransferase family 4 protein [Gemmatimonadales bacterium]
MSLSALPRPKRILIFSEDYPPADGGIAQWAHGMAHGLSHQGHTVEVCTRRRGSVGGAAKARRQDDTVPVTFAEGKRWRRYRTWYWRRAARNFLASGPAPDFILCTTWNCARGVLPLARRRGVPVVTAVYGLEVTRRMPWFKRWWLRRTLLGSHRVVAVSTFTANRVLSDSPALVGRVVVLPGGVDPTRFVPGPKLPELMRRFGLTEEDRVILTLARVVPRKGHDQVIRALPQILLKTPTAKYLICGTGPAAYVERLRRQVEDQGVSDAVIFGGYVESRELNDVYNLCDVYVMPSREMVDEGDVEGFGITFLEANACQKPVVGGDSGGIPDAVVDGETGYVVDPIDSDAIAHAVTTLLSNSELADRLGRQGYTRVTRRYTWNTLAAELGRHLLPEGG